jgi:hypothetical protein
MSMSKFEDHLWREFVSEHGDDLAQLRRPATRHRLRTRGLVAGAGLGLAGGATALALVLSATSAPAFAVTSNPNGTVTVTVNQIAGVSGANTELATLGVSARAVPIVQGCTAALQLLPKAADDGILAPVNDGLPQSITIEPSAIPAGDTLVLAVKQSAGAVQMLDGMVQGSAPVCVPPALPKKALP